MFPSILVYQSLKLSRVHRPSVVLPNSQSWDLKLRRGCFDSESEGVTESWQSGVSLFLFWSVVSGLQDQLVWSTEMGGKFTVKSAYLELQ